jgi:hypothetical protein
MSYRQVASLVFLVTIVVSGCSNEHELPIAYETKTVSFFDRGSLSNPVKVQRLAGKQPARRAGNAPRLGR